MHVDEVKYNLCHCIHLTWSVPMTMRSCEVVHLVHHQQNEPCNQDYPYNWNRGVRERGVEGWGGKLGARERGVEECEGS